MVLLVDAFLRTSTKNRSREIPIVSSFLWASSRTKFQNFKRQLQTWKWGRHCSFPLGMYFLFYFYPERLVYTATLFSFVISPLKKQYPKWFVERHLSNCLQKVSVQPILRNSSTHSNRILYFVRVQVFK